MKEEKPQFKVLLPLPVLQSLRTDPMIIMSNQACQEGRFVDPKYAAK